MSSEDSTAKKDRVPIGFYIIATWICGVWGFVGLLFVGSLISLVSPKRNAAQSSTSYSTPYYATYTPAPTPSLDRRLKELDLWYSRLTAKYRVLDREDSDAVTAYNEEARRYTNAVTYFRADRAKHLQADAASNRSGVEASPFTAYSPAPTPNLDSRLKELDLWYSRLNAKYKALNLNDSNAVTVYQEEARRYTNAVAYFRADRSKHLRAYPAAQRADVEFPLILPASQTRTPAVFSGAYGYTAPSSSDHYVSGYTRSNGTMVQGYYRTNPDGFRGNNYSAKGNINPYSGRRGTVPY